MQQVSNALSNDLTIFTRLSLDNVQEANWLNVEISIWLQNITQRLRLKQKPKTYLQVLKEYRISCPIDLREQILIQHFAHQLEEIDFALIVRLTLEEREKR
jgi:hypothetical protein